MTGLQYAHYDTINSGSDGRTIDRIGPTEELLIVLNFQMSKTWTLCCFLFINRNWYTINKQRTHHRCIRNLRELGFRVG